MVCLFLFIKHFIRLMSLLILSRESGIISSPNAARFDINLFLLLDYGQVVLNLIEKFKNSLIEESLQRLRP